MIAPLQIELMGGKVGCPPRDDWLVRLPDQLHLEHVHDRRGDFALNGKDIVHLAVVTFGPQMAAVGDSDQLRGDANPIAGPPYAAFEDVRHRESLPNPPDVLMLA